MALFFHTRTSRPRIVLWVTLVSFVGTADAVRAQEPDFYTAIEALKKFEKTIQSLCLTGRYKETADHPINPDNNYAQENTHYLVKFEHDLTQGRWRYDVRASWIYKAYSNVPTTVRRVESFEGQRSYSLYYTYISEPTGAGLPPSKPFKLDIRMAQGSLPGSLHPLRLAGLGFKHLGQDSPSLLTLLESEPCTWEGKDRVAGADCYKITIRPRSGDLLITVWLDAGHGYLPRREEHRRRNEPGGLPRIVESVETTHFQEFDTPDGKKIWFPTRGRSEMLSGALKNSFELQELRFEATLPAEHFQFDPEDLPPGVFVNDRPGGAKYYTGGEDGQKIYEDVQRLFDAVDENLKEKLGPHPDSMPPPKRPFAPRPKDNAEANTSSWLITNVVLLALVGGGWLVYRFQRFITKHRAS